MIFAVPPQPAVTRNSPSGLKATLLTSRRCQILESSSPVAGSHNLAAASPPQGGHGRSQPATPIEPAARAHVECDWNRK